MSTDFTASLRIEAPSARVRAALTTAAGIQGWWSQDSDVAEQIGGRTELRFDKGGRTVVMRFVVDAAGDTAVRWTCTENGNPVWVDSTIEWALTPDGDSTRLDFAHRGLTMPGSPPHQMTLDGWPPFLQSLKDYVETGAGRPW